MSTKPGQLHTFQLREKLATNGIFLVDALSELDWNRRIISSYECGMSLEKLKKAKAGELLVKTSNAEVDPDTCHVSIIHVSVGFSVFHGELQATVDRRGRVTSVGKPIFFY